MLYFFPQVFTSSCTLEAKAFQRDIDSVRPTPSPHPPISTHLPTHPPTHPPTHTIQYNKLNAQIVGVSVDESDKQTDFKSECGLDFIRKYALSTHPLTHPPIQIHSNSLETLKHQLFSPSIHLHTHPPTHPPTHLLSPVLSDKGAKVSEASSSILRAPLPTHPYQPIHPPHPPTPPPTDHNSPKRQGRQGLRGLRLCP